MHKLTVNAVVVISVPPNANLSVALSVTYDDGTPVVGLNASDITITEISEISIASIKFASCGPGFYVLSFTKSKATPGAPLFYTVSVDKGAGFGLEKFHGQTVVGLQVPK